MPNFAYKAKEGPNKIVDGVIEAKNLDTAISIVISKGLSPIDVSPTDQKKGLVEQRTENLRIRRKVSSKDIVLFTRQMCDLIDAAVPVLRALEIVSKQTRNLKFKEEIDQMKMHVRDGGSLSAALNAKRSIFSPLYISMVRTGELGGNLDIVMNRLADYVEKEAETISKVRASLAYPLLILFVGFILIFVLFSFVIPNISMMFDDLDQQLPTITVVMMNLSYVFASYWWLIISVLALVFTWQYKNFQSQTGREKFDLWALKLPFFGNFLKVVEVGRFSRTLGTLIESGVAIPNALQSVARTINNSVIKADVKRVAQEVENGASLRSALKKCPHFPEMAVNMMSVGEETGNLSKGLNKVAESYDKQSDQLIKTLISLLGPSVLIVIVAIVGVVLIALMLPIFQMNTLL